MIGLPVDGPRHEEDPSEEDWFIPTRGLNIRASVLESQFVQSRAMEQSCLPRDGEILATMLNCDLHLALRSYLLCGALVEQEFYGRLEHVREVYSKLQEKLDTEKTSRESAEAQVVAQEKELEARRRSDGKWRREVEMREEILRGLSAYSNKKSATITKLKENIGRLEHEIREREDRVKYLEGEIEVKRQESPIAFERARLAHQNVENLQAQLKEEVDHMKRFGRRRPK